jgi:tetratricopeptide (TPR) repeat protein
MRKRCGWRMLLALALLSPLGCSWTGSGGRDLLRGFTPSDPAANTGNQAATQPQQPNHLPSEEAAKLSLVHANLLAEKGHEAKAIQQYEAARQHNPNANISAKLAVLYDRQMQDAKALAEYQKALQASPRDSNLLNDVGYFFLTRNNHAEAERHLRKALELDGKNQRAWGNLALALAYQGRYPDSFECWAKVNTPAQAHYNVAMIMLQHERPDLAERSLLKALEIDPGLKIARAVLDELHNPRPVQPKQPADPRTAQPRRTAPEQDPRLLQRHATPANEYALAQPDAPPPLPAATAQPTTTTERRPMSVRERE